MLISVYLYFIIFELLPFLFQLDQFAVVFLSYLSLLDGESFLELCSIFDLVATCQ